MLRIPFGRKESVSDVHQPPRDPPHRPGEAGLHPGGAHAEERCGPGRGRGLQQDVLVRPIPPQDLQVATANLRGCRFFDCRLFMEKGKGSP